MPPEGPTRPATEHPGQPSWIAPFRPVVPDHELLRRIGGGSYGDVWLARSVVGAWRAVKVVFRDRFLDARPYEREFNGIQKFEPLSRSNEGFIDILQIGRNDSEGYFYYVMELADEAGPEAKSNQSSVIGNQSIGPEARQPLNTDHCSLNTALEPSTYVPKTLSKALLQRGRLPVSECLELGITLNLALARLHTAGLIHRDIKPSNIIFVGGVPKLADIGLVIEFAEARSYVGTEGFIPPEGPNSPQADLYSLGKVLYEAGMGKDRKEFPEPLTQLVEAPDAPELLEFNAILLKACAANVKDRYQSAEEMNADLALLQGGRSVRKQRKLVGQLRFVQRAGALVTALAAVIAAGWLWQARQTHLVQGLASEKTRLADEKSKLAEENRQRLVRLDIANGVRLMDQEDYSGALLWFAEALPLVTNSPAEEAIHRIRIQQVLNSAPRLLVSVACPEVVAAGAWSPDGKRFALTTYTMRNGQREWLVQLHDAVDGRLIWKTDLGNPGWVSQLRFGRDGTRLLVSSPPTQGLAVYGAPPPIIAAALSTDTGREVFPRFASDLEWAVFSSDERWLALARSNQVIQILSATGGAPVVELKGHTNKITMLSFSADGSLLASASEDRSARLWRLPSGEEAVPAMLHDRPLCRAVLSDDASRLATATIGDQGDGDDGQVLVHVWDAQSGKRIGGAITEPSVPYALFFTRGSGNRLFTGGNGPKIRVWDTRSSSLLPLGEFNHTGGRCWDFSPDGAFLSMGDDDGHADLFRLTAGEHILSRIQHTGYVESVHFSPDGTRLLTTSDDATAKVWSLRQQTESAVLPLSANLTARPPNEVHPRGRTPGPIPIGLKDGALHLIDPDPLAEAHCLKPQQPGTSLANLMAGSTGRFWAVVEAADFNDDKCTCTVNLCQREGTSWRHRSLPHPKIVPFGGFTPDDSRLITFCRDWSVRIWRTSDGALERTIPVPPSFWYLPLNLGGAWFSKDGGALLVVPGGHGDYLQLFDLTRGQLTGKPFSLASISMPNKVQLAPDGSRVAMVGTDQSGSIIDLRTGNLAVPQFKHGGTLLDLDWNPDGKSLLTAGLSHDVKIWDAATGELLLSPLPTGKGGSGAARWSADARFIVTRSDDNCARVWDASTAEAVTPLLRHSGYIRSACVTPGNRLITASDPNLLRAWDLKPSSLAADILADYSKLLSGRRLNASGALLSIKPAELEQLHRSLRARAPQLFE